ncbi:hypothetical protein [Pseudochelatococcus sp. G4_1912]|uniref:hypothetical protein n=1 Tax=Pseudochelatococcus sp. G4_1912 TaxID=3114288 RepID=UPI0039C7091E
MNNIGSDPEKFIVEHNHSEVFVGFLNVPIVPEPAKWQRQETYQLLTEALEAIANTRDQYSSYIVNIRSSKADITLDREDITRLVEWHILHRHQS